ncbi:hypothetical protein, conserved [Eimeria brunetti]|uniref:RlmI-like PUA domain-containing protein n=1 Tax=Eimeria brunetti TaxID=51314 RepID=U6LFZ0_9EIME|nr:hypothetical protein, conserved [Eimeria brunetti]
MQTGKLLPVYDSDGRYLGSGLFSRQASVAVRMITHRSSSSGSSSSSSSSNSSSSDAPDEGSLTQILCDRFRAAVNRRRLYHSRQLQPAGCTATGSSSSSNSSSSSSSSSTGVPDVWRAVDGEADGLPGVEVDVYGSAVVLRLSSQSVLPYRDRFVSLIKETLKGDTLSVQVLNSKKEKQAQGGAEYVSELELGSDPTAWVSGIGIGLCSSSSSSSSSSGSSSSSSSSRSEQAGRRSNDEERQERGGGVQQQGAASLVLLEASQAVHTLNEKAAAANNLAAAVSCIYSEDILKELIHMKASALRFRGVYIHLNPHVRFAAAERGGQFGRWFRPCLRGVQQQLTAAAALVEAGGLLAASLQVPIHLSSWLQHSICRAVETAGKKPSLVFASAASPHSQ